MKQIRLICVILLFLCGLIQADAAAPLKTGNVFLIMTDGVRWHEVFEGADQVLMNKENGLVEDVTSLNKAYWRETPEARREALLPFVWKEMASKGQIFGNRSKGSDVYVTNGMNFSYPGFSETITGYGDPRVDSNDKIPNPNVSVFEWLNQKPAFKGKVGAFGAWDTFNAIFNDGRCGFSVNSGYDPMTQGKINTRIELLNRLKAESPRQDWEGEPFDCLTHHTALEWLKENQPSLFFLALGESDEWPHARNYAEYLNSIKRADDYLRELWETAQSMPKYKDKTTILFMTDHGRGESPAEWKGHGKDTKNSQFIWIAVMGPDTKALGERTNIAPVTQNQVAATIARLLGEDFNAASPNAGQPILDVLPGGK